jgi:hypothetical protein
MVPVAAQDAVKNAIAQDSIDAVQQSVNQALPFNIVDVYEKIKRNAALKRNDKEAIIVSRF